MELTTQQALQQAVIAHKEGKLADAENLYRAILKAQPNHPDANHNLGVLVISLGNASTALPLFELALTANPEVDQYWLSYIDALIQNQQTGDALEMLKRAIQHGVPPEKLHTFEEKLKSLFDGNAPKLEPKKKRLKFSEKRKQEAYRKKQKKLRNSTTPPQQQLDNLLRHYQSGQFAFAEDLATSITREHPKHPFAWKVLGAVSASRGRHSTALAAHQKAASLAPEDAEAHFNVALTQDDLGRFKEAEASYNKAVALQPQYADAHCNLGNTLRKQGRLEDAAASYKRAIALRPDLVIAYNNLSVTLRELGNLSEAEAIGRQCVELKPDYAEAHNNFGNTLKEQGRLIEAGESYKRAIAIRPAYAEAHNNLGITLQELGKFGEAEASFRRSIGFDTELANAHSNLGFTLQRSGRFTEAEASYKQAIRLKPDHVDAHNNLGITLQALGRSAEAEASLKQAITLKPDNVEAHNNLGNSLKAQGKYTEAAAHYQQAIALQSDYAVAHFNLGNALKEMGRLEAAIESYTCAANLDSECPAFWLSANFYFSTVQSSVADIKRERENFVHAMRRLQSMPGSRHQSLLEFDIPIFYLAYHNFDDNRLLLQELQTTLKAAPFTSQLIYQPKPAPAYNDRRDVITLGICSQYLSNHTIGQLYEGLIGHLTAVGFEIILFTPSSAMQDNVREAIEHLASTTINLSSNPHVAASQIEEANLDFLFYPDIGMSPFTYQLALSRLAPVQATSWGHPTTTGLDTMDYFISSDLIEPQDAHDHYSEQLVLLSRLPAVYTKPVISGISSNRQSFALPENGVLIGVPQSLFKFHPDFDDILEQIMRSLPDALLVLIQSKQDINTERLKARWERQAPAVHQRAVFLPRLSRQNFIGLLGAVDFLLDPIYFGSGNTFYEAMAFGTPIVTLPGSRMSGRAVSGGYKQMRIEKPPVASSETEYVDWCVRLGSDRSALAALRAELRAAADQHLFGDAKAAKEFAEFIREAVIASRSGSDLPERWRAHH